MSKIICCYDLITPGFIRGLIEEAKSHHGQSKYPLRLLVHKTRTEPSILAETMDVALELYHLSKDRSLPNIYSIAGQDICNIGFILFLAGTHRRIMPNVSFRLTWNPLVAAIFVAETKDQDHVAKVVDNTSHFNVFQIKQLGIACEYYRGPLPPLLNPLITSNQAPP